MAFNPIDNKNPPAAPVKAEQKYIGGVPQNHSERNDYGHGLAEDQEVRILYFKDRKTYKPSEPFRNEPPEAVFDTEGDFSHDDGIPDFVSDSLPPEAYLNDAPGLDSISEVDFWESTPSPMDDFPQDQTDFSNTSLSNTSHSQHIPENVSHETLTENKNNSPENQADNSSPQKAKYNYSKLESVPLDFLLIHMGAEPINSKKTKFVYFNQEFDIEGQRWINYTFNRGYEGAISLCKELIAIHDRVDPFKNSRILGGKACRYLEKVFADYVKNYRKEPPVFEKNNNYKTAEKESNIDRPNPNNLFSFIEFDYKKLTSEEKNTYFTILENINFNSVAKLFNMDSNIDNVYTLKNNQDKLTITVEDRTWVAKVNRKEKFGIGSLNLTAFLMEFAAGEDAFHKDVFKKNRLKSSKFLAEKITSSDIDNEAYRLETMEIDKNDPTYLYVVPYHRLDKEEQEKYFQGLENFSLERLASMLGGTDYEDGKADLWKFHETFMTENITINQGENQWKSWNSDGGGTGAISLLAYYLMAKDGVDFNDKTLRKNYRFSAAKELAKHMLDGDITFERKGSLKAEVFTMPYILDAKLPHVKEYLCEKRQLPEWVVQKQINSGFLFASYPAHWKEIPKLKTPEFMSNDLVWATFLTVSGQAAEMRGIARSDHNAKILAKGSDKDLGGFLTKAEQKYNEYTVCSFEAAIDSLSYHAIYPGRITQSCMGTEYKLAAKAAADILRVTAVKTKHSCCFDNDYAGIKATVRYFNHLKDLMSDEDLQEEMLEKQKSNPDFTIPDEILYKDFFAAYKDGRINMFELTVKDFAESLAQNKIFYFDVLEDKIGLEAAKLFYEIASKELGRDVVKKSYATGQFKYMNILPTPKALENNLVEITKQTIDKLLTNHNYYLEMPDIESYLTKDGDDEFNGLSEEEKLIALSRTKKVLTDFYNEFEKQAGPQLSKLVESGSLVYERKTLFKDWNEYLIYMKDNKPEFAQMLKDREVEFASYSLPDAPKNKPGKIK